MTTNRGRIRVETGTKRVRAYLGGVPVADTLRPLLVWEGPHYPAYYLPAADVREDLITPDGERVHSPSRGDAERGTVAAGGRSAPGAALLYRDSPIEEIRGHYRFEWDALDAWFEEDEEVFTHPRDPYSRVDILPSSRLVRVTLAGVTLAESPAPRMLFETGLPVRYYLPKPHVHMELLEHTDTSTGCPYKGTAEYWSVRIDDAVYEDIAWSYRTPLPESRAIAGLVCFYNEKVDITVAPG
jgi:uncharacterized protein (DUF427 family)